jgi:hypothetical protein
MISHESPPNRDVNPKRHYLSLFIPAQPFLWKPVPSKIELRGILSAYESESLSWSATEF